MRKSSGAKSPMRPATVAVLAVVSMMAHTHAALAQDSGDGEASDNTAAAQPAPLSFPDLSVNQVNNSDAQNQVFLSQLGDGNRFQIQQENGRNRALVSVIGNNNGAGNINSRLLQQAGDNIAIIRTIGNDNSFDAVQTGLNGLNQLDLRQEGNLNDMRSRQQSSSGGENTALLLQLGSENLAEIQQTSLTAAGINEIVAYQDGFQNSLTANQDGGQNRIDLIQSGVGLSAIYQQFGLSNLIEASQTGANLGHSITQYGGASIRITQTTITPITK